MVESEKIYQSILFRLSSIPVDYLDQVDTYLQKFSQNIAQNKENQVEIMSLAGSWDDMTDQDFKEFLEFANDTGHELFSRDVEL